MEQQQEISNEEILKRTKEVVAYLCGKDHNLEIELDDSEYCDPLIRIGVAAIGWDFNDSLPFYYGAIVYNPGVMYYRDGSGEPPSEDFEPLGESYSWEQFSECVFEAVKVEMTKRLNDFQDMAPLCFWTRLHSY